MLPRGTAVARFRGRRYGSFAAVQESESGLERRLLRDSNTSVIGGEAEV